MKALPIAILGCLALPCAAGAAPDKCDPLLEGIDQLSGEPLIAAYQKVIACDPKVAQQAFPQFMRMAGDADTLVALSLTAIDADVWNPVWEMIGKLSSYDARDEVALRVGSACATDPKVIGFLQGAYFNLREIDFQQWDDALLTCDAPAFDEWLVRQVTDPPPKVYDDKWSALAHAVVKRKQRDALPLLAEAAAKAARNGGPFEAILMLMEDAVAPAWGEALPPEDRAALESIMVDMARDLAPEKARSVADRLTAMGSETRAGGLLGAVYPGREIEGAFWYGAAAVEAGQCGNQKQAIVHFSFVVNPATYWIILPHVPEPARSAKPKLVKCKVDEPWPVASTSEPFASKADITAWVAEIVKEWEQKGYVVKTREEKDIPLP
ncbi:MAG: hypothetical protein JXB39_03955 [Deltaproteobacteria bacterium]|nr:hypothetical protein [Deltaproteobacteria bacterium]